MAADRVRSGSMNRIAVALFPNGTQAQKLQQKLVESGIAATIHEELWLQKLWFVSKEAAGVHVEVPAGQFEAAERLLHSWDTAQGAVCEAVHCPQCKSLLVDYPQFARNSVMTNIAAGLLAEVGLLEKDYYCEHCHYTWPKETSSRKRTHLAPYYFIEGVESRFSVSSGQKQRA